MFDRIKKHARRAKDPAHHALTVPENDPALSSDSDYILMSFEAAPVPARRSMIVPPPLPPVEVIPTARSQVHNSSRVNDPAPMSAITSAMATLYSTKRGVKATAWAGLKTFSEVLREGAHVFGPLKSAVDGILGCIEVYEREAKGRKDYRTLRSELDALFEDLASCFSGPTPPAMTPSIEGLAKGIEMEITLIKEREQRQRLGRYAGAMEDVDVVFECYRRIHMLLGRLALNANVNIWRIVDEISTDNCLAKLPNSPEAMYDSADSATLRRNGCIPNTRIKVLTELGHWTYSKNEKIFWLNGMAGTGKTTIAYSLCDQLHRASILAASFFCSRQLPSCRNVNRILPSISYQLALFSRPFRYAVTRVLESNPEVHNKLLPEQFRKLVFEPLWQVKKSIPANLVVVIDALDECDDNYGVDQILDILLSHAPNLPVKFFVSSRPEAKIVDQMRSGHDGRIPRELRLHELEHSIVHDDIKTFFQIKLAPINLSLADLENLVKRSGVLFIYAATVVRYIGADNFARSSKRVKEVLSSSTSAHAHNGKDVDTLYATILTAAFDDVDLGFSDRLEMRLVLHTVVCAREPLTVDTMAGFLGLEGNSSVRAALRPLLSIVHLSESSGLVTTLHESFPEYLLDESRSNRFHCDILRCNAWLAQRCFNIIQTPNPPFNICGLESSYRLDEEVPNLDERVNQAVSNPLFYACRYWDAHMVRAKISQDLLSALYDLLSVRLLLWMEILNLKRCIHAGASLLYRMRTWAESSGCSDSLRQLTEDAWRFVIAFSTSPASYSTPHIYVSALSFWPESRPISKHYSQRIPRQIRAVGTSLGRRDGAPLAICTADSCILAVAYSSDGAHIFSGSGFGDDSIRIWDARTGQMIGQPLQGHIGSVAAVACSSDGARVFSGSYDKTIRIWDIHTRQMIGQPLRGHTGSVSAVACSSDGAYIVSGSSDKSMRIWDVRTGRMTGQPLRGHTGSVSSVAYSSDDARIVSGSSDETIRIWDARTCGMIGLPLQGHTGSVWSVLYSSDSTRIISGSEDTTIRIWDAHSGQLIGQPLQGHMGSVSSVACSPSGSYVVSGSNDTTIRLWDVNTGQMIGQPLRGHTKSVMSVSYSSDGARIVSGSDDETIRIWDARTSLMVGQPFQGHTDQVWSVAYSSDGARIVSGSSDKSIRIWNAHSGLMVGQPLEGHTDSVTSVAYSSDGTHIVSGSIDTTVRIWDAHTGRMIGQPLTGHTSRITSVAYSSKGSYVVSGSDDTTLCIWDVPRGQMIGQRLQGHTDSVSSVAYSSNGTRIVSGSYDTTICIWDARTGRRIVQTFQDRGRVLSVAYSPNDASVASGHGDNSICIWDAHTGAMIGQPFQGHTWPPDRLPTLPTARASSRAHTTRLYAYGTHVLAK